ncbi:DNA-binding response regulator [Malaciobacter mytili LMG 24559]|uniref:DNA-binding response regulator n=1 Tax=Malaciobacter mytili LMG 24559 TaxID=1032238 RepID=A0AAX2AK30_9BACT|nr:response regulator transcription factor [Malaciobacter mytili]AXH13723.1 two-component system response regulator [Malaciobacter mytili LMG 24559]RXK16333.1 DNA-binding response regulator [Malaciobacter mytili LMG 24559]
MRVLLLEDDTLLNEIIEEFLEELDYEVVSTHDGQEALETIYEDHFDLLILDVNVPSINGFDLLKSLKDNKIDIPTIYITSLHTSKDIQEGFESGADDYIKKPFHLSELKLRINNIKRLRQIDNSGQVKLNNEISYNYDTKYITVEKQETHLSKTEAKVFEYLIKNKNRAVSIEEISLNNWLYDEAPTATTIRTYIKNLRKILGKDKILNLKAVGYKITL